MATDMLTKNGPPKDLTKSITEKPVAIMPPLVSLLIPCCGMKEYTKLGVNSIMKNTRMPYELIFLDIGSLDGTEDYLDGLKQGLQQVRIEVVRTPSDLGIPAACREALQRCRGEYVVLLNNDTIVTRGWIHKMTALLDTLQSVGMVGPMSNYAPAIQQVDTVPYRSGPRKSPRPGEESNVSRGLIDVEAVQAFADEIHKENGGKWVHAEHLGGFCLMIRRDLIKKFDQQGSLNKAMDLGLFDSEILSLKAKQLGYNLAVCRDLFIHHFGTRMFTHGASLSGSAGSVAVGQTNG
jgi:GT2 family glycosyltransferase